MQFFLVRMQLIWCARMPRCWNQIVQSGVLQFNTHQDQNSSQFSSSTSCNYFGYCGFGGQHCELKRNVFISKMFKFPQQQQKAAK
jgi:hypothetical protein